MNPKPEGRFRAAVRAVFREPLTHFALLGGSLFLAVTIYQATSRPVVRIDSAELDQLAAYWTLQTQRPPTREELAGIVRERIDEEILARDAVRRGLDQNDIIIRRRLAQKMAFAGEDSTPLAEPDDATLKAYYDKAPDRFSTPEKVSFTQVFFSDHRGHAQALAAARAALPRLADGETVQSDPLMAPSEVEEEALPTVERDYGPEFAAAVHQAAVGRWAGPFASAYGVHLIKLAARLPEVRGSFAEVRPQVREAWLEEARQKANLRFMDSLRRKYKVEIADFGGHTTEPHGDD